MKSEKYEPIIVCAMATMLYVIWVLNPVFYELMEGRQASKLKAIKSCDCDLCVGDY